MGISLSGTSGITTPGVQNTAGETIATTLGVTGAATVGGSLTVTGAVQGSGVATNLYPLVSGTAQASTSGTYIDFTGIPAWVKRITVMFAGLSTNSTSNYMIQLGTASGFETTDYVGAMQQGGSGTTTWNSTGLLFNATNYAASTYSGICTICLLGSDTWCESGTISQNVTGQGTYSAGYKALTTGALTQIRITTFNGTDTFDAGSINIMYE